MKREGPRWEARWLAFQEVGNPQKQKPWDTTRQEEEEEATCIRRRPAETLSHKHQHRQQQQHIETNGGSREATWKANARRILRPIDRLTAYSLRFFTEPQATTLNRFRMENHNTRADTTTLHKRIKSMPWLFFI